MVVLKSLNNSSNITLDFLREIANTKLLDSGANTVNNTVVHCYGISQDPTTKNYVMVMKYMEGELRNKETTQFTQQIQEADEYNLCPVLTKLYQQYREKEREFRKLLFPNPQYEIHPQNTYTSKMIDTKQITEKIEEYKTKQFDLTLGLAQTNISEINQEQSSTQAQIEIPPK
ncbi:8418_t:CDS:2 [Ambispora leptoticha]|uniref:8418_t:CDS:1 n=1 Tax=Ambispora leptoticha TaxID=144679 RepID=A0A9N8YPF4_9GLOM|nr:8418_t:CDS:2 [Ambispora leptoticha]